MIKRRGGWLLGCALGALASLSARGALAGPDDVTLLPTVSPISDAPGAAPVLRRPERYDGRALTRWARQLDVILGESAQDLGLTLDVSRRSQTVDPDETALVERATAGWVISPRLSFDGGELELRIVAVAPGSKVVLSRVERVAPKDFEVRAMVMLRDVVQAGRHAPASDAEAAAPRRSPPDTVSHARSEGRAVLALNSAVLGGYIGLSLQRASGSGDPRLTYPLVALGAGIGLGGAMIVADEWDVGLGDAWYLSAGAWWPAATGLLLAEGYGVSLASDRYVYGVIGAGAGITLATTALTMKGMGEGGAALAHSGGAFGLLFGGMAELAYHGRLDVTPSRGMGYGAGAGVLVAGALATQVHVASSRVLLVDLGATLGGLTGAAAAGPLVFGGATSAAKDRAWLASVAAGTLVGAGVGLFITRPRAERQAATRPALGSLEPWGGVIGESVSPDGRRAPVIGAGATGVW